MIILIEENVVISAKAPHIHGPFVVGMTLVDSSIALKINRARRWLILARCTCFCLPNKNVNKANPITYYVVLFTISYLGSRVDLHFGLESPLPLVPFAYLKINIYI